MTDDCLSAIVLSTDVGSFTVRKIGMRRRGKIVLALEQGTMSDDLRKTPVIQEFLAKPTRLSDKEIESLAHKAGDQAYGPLDRDNIKKDYNHGMIYQEQYIIKQEIEKILACR